MYKPAWMIQYYHSRGNSLYIFYFKRLPYDKPCVDYNYTTMGKKEPRDRWYNLFREKPLERVSSRVAKVLLSVSAGNVGKERQIYYREHASYM